MRSIPKLIGLALAVTVVLAVTVAPAALGSPLTGDSSSHSSPSQSAVSTQSEFAPGLVEQAILNVRHWVLKQQRQLQRRLSERLRQLQAAPSVATASVLVLVSFLYGVLHASGPGHGKLVISTYLLTHRQRAREGVFIASLAALMQGLTAIVLVFALVKVGGWLTRDAMGQVRLVETFSFALLALLGAWLILRGLRKLLSFRKEKDHPSGRDETGRCLSSAGAVTPPVASKPGLGTRLAVVMAVGIRPCTGAVMVLGVANLLNLWLAGVLAVLAMSIGTAITVSLLAILAIRANHLLERLPLQHRVYWRLAGPIGAIVGGLAILAVGLLLLQGSALLQRGAPTHPLLSAGASLPAIKPLN